jgi:hypothetical protein
MAKRTKQKTKKREQPWIEAARAALRKNADARRRDAPRYVPTSRPPGEDGPYDETEAIVDALLDMAGDDLVALPPDADDNALDNILGIAVLAYNHPLDYVLPPQEGELISHGETMRHLLENASKRSPAFGAKFRRMLDVRTRRYPHLAVPVTACRATWGKNRTVDIVIRLVDGILDDEAGGGDPGDN